MFNHRGERRKARPGPARLVEHGSGGLFATILSAVALGFSGFSYYDSSLKTADLTVYVPPMIHYGRDGEADVFNIPITIANEGARNGTVLTMELDVQNLNPNAEKKTAKFHSAFLGDYPHDDTTVSRSFAPLSIPGHGTVHGDRPFLSDGRRVALRRRRQRSIIASL